MLNATELFNPRQYAKLSSSVWNACRNAAVAIVGDTQLAAVPQIRVLLVERDAPNLRLRSQVDVYADARGIVRCGAQIGPVVRVPNLESALTKLSEEGKPAIIVTSGYHAAEVSGMLQDIDKSLVEIICVLPPTAALPEQERPSASLLHVQPHIVVADIDEALRKSVLRLGVEAYTTVRCLQTAQDLRDYFGFRYKIWKHLRYLPAKKDCTQSKWELDYTDRTAIPIGAFHKSGRLIGCARLVRGFGEEYPGYVSLISALLREKGDACLVRNFVTPPNFMHPYDILEGFAGFKPLYRQLVKDRVPKAEVSRVIVDPQYRGNGVGEVLVDSLVSLAKSLGIEVLFLACKEKHKDFYEKSGFRAIEGVWCDHFINVRQPSIAMQRKLSASE